MRPRLHPLACPCRILPPAAGASQARFPVPAPLRRCLLDLRAAAWAFFSR
jgi:hypothetical protein